VFGADVRVGADDEKPEVRGEEEEPEGAAVANNSLDLPDDADADDS